LYGNTKNKYFNAEIDQKRYMKHQKKDKSRETVNDPSTASSVKSKVPFIILGIVTAIVVLVRLRLLSVPLERDEGEYAYMGQSLLQGIQPYAEAYNMKLPGMYYLYALIMSIFGQTPSGIHLGLLLFHLGSVAMLFLIGKRLSDAGTGAIAAASFSLLSLAPWTYGLAAHASHFIAFFSLAGLLFLLKAAEKQKIALYLTAGVMFGIAFIVKQQAAFFLLFGGLSVLLWELKRKPKNIPVSGIHIGAFTLGAVLPYTAVVLTAVMTGTFEQFWHWTVSYANQYVGINDFGKGMQLFSGSFKAVTTGVAGFWVLSLLGLAAIWMKAGKPNTRQTVLLFALFAFFSICPGLYFRNHYFIALFPALGLLVAAALRFVEERLGKNGFAASTIVFTGLILFTLYTFSDFYFKYSPADVCARMYGRNPFQESVKVAQFLQNNSAPSDRIAVFGSEPQIYFYSKRKAATGYLYTYPMMENQPYHLDMQKDMIAELEGNKPRYIVVINSNISWLAGPQSDNYIMKWFETYSAANYHLVGLVDMVSPIDARYVWKQDLANYQMQGKENIQIMERN
jgi:hypothetical protein